MHEPAFAGSILPMASNNDGCQCHCRRKCYYACVDACGHSWRRKAQGMPLQEAKVMCMKSCCTHGCSVWMTEQTGLPTTTVISQQPFNASDRTRGVHRLPEHKPAVRAARDTLTIHVCGVEAGDPKTRVLRAPDPRWLSILRLERRRRRVHQLMLCWPKERAQMTFSGTRPFLW